MKKRFFVTRSGPIEERAFLVGVRLPSSTREEEEHNIDELELLAETAGALVVGKTIQSRTRIDGSTYIGVGKLAELQEQVYRNNVNLVIFDDDLSPAQARNIENRLNVNVIDRTELILDIFARRARTKQAKIQVEIAQLNYALPRLRRLWAHLSRQAGGIGTRGPGETQLEVDRRKVRERVARLEKELDKIDRRSIQRRKRRSELFNVTLVGYTNAGKSSIMNRISGSTLMESGNMFSTLDSTTRKVTDRSGQTFLLTDTVGFIRKLPTHLVESFKATLLDVTEADLLMHIVDISSPQYKRKIEVVNTVLSSVLSGSYGDGDRVDVPTIVVFNKIDKIGEDELEGIRLFGYPGAVFTSAQTGEGIRELVDRIESAMKQEMVHTSLRVRADNGKAIALIEECSIVETREVIEESILFDIYVHRSRLPSILRQSGVEVVGVD